MSIYFDFKTINELTGDNYNRQPKEFTLEELSQYNGSNGKPAYVAIEGIVYDISNSATWGGGTHFGFIAGQDLTSQFNSCHGVMDILTNTPKVGTLKEEDYMGDMNNMDDMDDTDDMNNMSSMSSMGNMNSKRNMCMKRQTSQDKSKFTPDDWIRYITPLVIYALREPSEGMNTQSLYQKVILMGVLVGLGKTPQEAINQVRDWQNTGASQILKSGTGSGTGTFGGVGTGGSQGTVFGGGTGGSTGGGAGTSGGIGTSGNTGTGFGTGGSQGTGFGSGTGGSTGGGASTSGGIGTSGNAGTGFGTGGSQGTGFGSGLGGSTGGGVGTSGGMGTSGNAGTGFGSGGSQGTGLNTSTVTSGNTNRNSRLDLD